MTDLPVRAAAALADRLEELAQVVAELDDVTYGTSRHPNVSGTIGAHVRHTLDHVTALVEPPISGVVDYDTRRRSTAVERHRHTGAAELRRLAVCVRLLPADADARPVALSAMVDRTGERLMAPSTIGREFIFVLSHTIHHQAIIALLLTASGTETPDDFGVAPSTPRLPCARSA